MKSNVVHHLTPRRKFVATEKSATLESMSSMAQRRHDGVGGGAASSSTAEAHEADDGGRSAQNGSRRRRGSDNDEEENDDDKDGGIPTSSLSSSSSSSSLSSSSSSTSYDNDDDDDPPSTEREALVPSLPPDVDVEGLSEYEILRLRRIRRNEARLESLGLGGGLAAAASAASGSNVEDGKGGGGVGVVGSEKARKAAITRRANAERARRAIEEHERRRRTVPPRAASANVPGRVAGTFVDTSPSPSSSSSWNRASWKARLDELVSYRESHRGRDPTRKSSGSGEGGDGAHDRSLCDWLNRQRRQYALYVRGERCTLDDDRVRMLEAGLGVDWWRSRRYGTDMGAVGRRRRGLNGGFDGGGGGGWRMTGRGRQSKNDDDIASRRRGSGSTHRRRSSSRGSISRRLWRSSSEESDDDEDEDDIIESLYDERADELDDDDVELGSLDTYSVDEISDDRSIDLPRGEEEEFEEEEEDDSAEGGGRPGDRIRGERGVGIGSPARKRRKSIVVSSLEKIAPVDNYIGGGPSRRGGGSHTGGRSDFILTEIERDRLLAEYGRLYSRRRSIIERMAILEREVSVRQAFMIANSNASLLL